VTTEAIVVPTKPNVTGTTEAVMVPTKPSGAGKSTDTVSMATQKAGSEQPSSESAPTKPSASQSMTTGTNLCFLLSIPDLISQQWGTVCCVCIKNAKRNYVSRTGFSVLVNC
jgi:hypothetical protein